MGLEIAASGVQALQVATVALGAPWVSGVIARVEAVVQGRHGPRILQPYYDLIKLFGKESLRPAGAGAIFLIAPFVAFACYLTVPLLIPILTTFGLPLGSMGDILGGAFVLALAAFFVSVAAAETGAPYAQLGASRTTTFSALTEPVLLFVIFTVGLLSGTDLPYKMAETVTSSASQLVRPAHLLASVAMFLVVLVETGRIPVESHRSTNELGMIEHARTLEHSGPYLALLTWGSQMKQMILYALLLNVFVLPWGLASDRAAGSVVWAIVSLLLKCVAVGVVVTAIDNSFSKLRLFKITEFIAAAFLLAVIAVLTLYLGGG